MVLMIFLFLTFALRLVFVRVAMSLESLSSVPKPSITRVDPPPEMVNLSEVNTSLVPSLLVKTYLSSSNGKNVSLVPAVGIVFDFN